MSASHAPAIDAIAFQLAGLLETYGEKVERMVDTWLDMELYREVSDAVEEIRTLSVILPGLSVQWVELLIAHTELVHALWRGGQAGADPEKVGAIQANHARCVGM